MPLNENYPLAGEHDHDFDKPHPYTKSYGDYSIRNYCRCERHRDDVIHKVIEEVAHDAPSE